MTTMGRPEDQEIVAWLHEYRDLTDQISLLHCRIAEWRLYFAQHSKLLLDNWERLRCQETTLAVADEKRELFTLQPANMSVEELHRMLTEVEKLKIDRERLKRKLDSQQLGSILKT